MLKKYLIAVLFAAIGPVAQASVSAVDSASCHLVAGSEKPFILVLKEGE